MYIYIYIYSFGRRMRMHAYAAALLGPACPQSAWHKHIHSMRAHDMDRGPQAGQLAYANNIHKPYKMNN